MYGSYLLNSASLNLDVGTLGLNNLAVSQHV